MHNFRELKIWQRSRVLVKEIYILTGNFPSNEIFGLTSQIRRAAFSLNLNIAEGSGRGTNKEFARFLDMTNGSACELESALLLSLDLEYITKTDAERLTKEILEIQKMLFSLKESLSKSNDSVLKS